MGDGFSKPGNVIGLRWCTGTMISKDLICAYGLETTGKAPQIRQN